MMLIIILLQIIALDLVLLFHVDFILVRFTELVKCKFSLVRPSVIFIVGINLMICINLSDILNISNILK